jgi:isoquinoline 1-oxidoreductase beta subunit
LRGKLDDNGRLQAIQHHQASGDVAFPFLPGFLKTVMGADFGAWRGSIIQYDVPNINTTAWRIELPIPTGWWRGLGLLANIFAIESFMDEAAHAAGVDPLQFRLNHLPDTELGERFRAVLQAAADKAGWDTPAPAGRSRGIACCIDVGTVVAEVAEVSVEEGQIRVHKVTAAMDPGMVINPDGAAAQTEGAIIMGMSSVFNEAITVKDGQVVPANFDTYPLLTMDRTPDIDVVLLESGSEPFGIGEPPIGPIAAAIANAVFAATGQRLRELPLKL